ncbi:MAG: SUMF1/EgtB/PvdO family nonheme iron enzyme, partial [Planctomycetes bacterium]|nr:SUMF1/EgtB/PvdO family nonheme iron enzyme [Planctomycetota bacterium]
SSRPKLPLPPGVHWGESSGSYQLRDAKVELAWIPPGAFVREGGTKVVIGRGFFLGTCEVTQEQYARFCDETGHPFPRAFKLPGKDLSDGLPVSNVSFTDSVAYCRWARVRLASDSEWEYAAVGRDSRPWPWGSKNVMNHNGGSRSDGFPGLSPVKSYLQGRSPFGVFDLAGNVSEWTADPFVPEEVRSQTERISTRRANGERARVIHGDNYGTAKLEDRLLAYRQSREENFRSVLLGFRIAISAR